MFTRTIPNFLISVSRVREISKSKKLKSSRSQTKQLFTQILLACASGIEKSKKQSAPVKQSFHVLHFLVENRSSTSQSLQIPFGDSHWMPPTQPKRPTSVGFPQLLSLNRPCLSGHRATSPAGLPLIGNITVGQKVASPAARNPSPRKWQFRFCFSGRRSGWERRQQKEGLFE